MSRYFQWVCILYSVWNLRIQFTWMVDAMPVTYSLTLPYTKTTFPILKYSFETWDFFQKRIPSLSYLSHVQWLGLVDSYFSLSCVRWQKGVVTAWDLFVLTPIHVFPLPSFISYGIVFSILFEPTWRNWQRRHDFRLNIFWIEFYIRPKIQIQALRGE